MSLCCFCDCLRRLDPPSLLSPPAATTRPQVDEVTVGAQDGAHEDPIAAEAARQLAPPAADAVAALPLEAAA
jgi:hypothetical protein